MTENVNKTQTTEPSVIARKETMLKEQIGQLLFHLQTSSSETERQACLRLLEKTLRKYYDLKQKAGK